jgi:two-component system sensor histidine kinase QseC
MLTPWPTRLSTPLRSLSRYVLRPTLVRRVTLVMLAAFALMWSLMIAYLYHRIDMAGDTDARRLQWAGELLAVIERYPDDAAARIAAEVTSERLNSSYNQSNGLGAFVLQVSHPDGRVLFLSPQAQGTAIDNGAAGARSMPVAGQRYRLYTVGSPRWRLTVGRRIYDSGWAFTQMRGELAVFFFLTLPFMLVPLWIAVARGLLPLRRLSQSIAARGPDDLQPLVIATAYEELLPLTSALDRMLAQLRATMQRERAFVADAAHELRTPMAVIAAQAHVLVKADGAAQRVDAEQKLEHAIARASHLIGQLLALAHVDSGEQRGLAVLDLAALVRNELALLAPAAFARRLDLSLDAPDVLLHAVEAHALRSILHNLVGNALRYVQEGGQVCIALAARDGALTLVVEDNGPGIAPDQRERVFERFYRGAQQDAHGSGLGLAIARQAAARLGGTVVLESGAGGVGCRFIVSLPAAA